jgi:hypothetical protein
MITYTELLTLLEGKTSAMQRRRNQRGFSHAAIKSEFEDRPSLIVKTKKRRPIKNDDDVLDEDVSDEELEVFAEEFLLESLNTKDRKDIALKFKEHKNEKNRAEKIALSHKASRETIEHRAHKMAILLLKKKLAKKPLDSLSIVEKQRLEDLIKKKSIIVDKLSKRLVQKILKLERNRLNK